MFFRRIAGGLLSGSMIGPFLNSFHENARLWVRRFCIAALLLGSLGFVPAEAKPANQLFEFTPWLIKNAGPAKAKGVIYFARGWGQFNCCRNRDDFQMVPYFLKTLNNQGWDVVTGKVPAGPRSEFAFQAVPWGVAHLKRRIRELRAQGYKRVVLGGHSWGGWLTLVSGQDKALGADALIISSPSTYGPAIIPGGPRKGQRNPRHMRNWTEFRTLVAELSAPTVLITMRDDPFEPAAPRGEYAAQQFGKNKVPYLVFDKPRGFIGHSAAWLPAFDFVHGQCIADFLDRSETKPCPGAKLSADDFRSMISFSQLPRNHRGYIHFPQLLAGKKFVAYTLGDSVRHYDYRSASQRLNMYSLEQHREAFAFKDGFHCVGRKCSILVWWADRLTLEFDAKTGKLAAWWIEHDPTPAAR